MGGTYAMKHGHAGPSPARAKLWTRSYSCLIVANSLATIAYTLFTCVLPLYVAEIGGDNATAGWLAGAVTLVLMISRPLAGAVMDRLEQRRVVLLGGLMMFCNAAAYFVAGNIPVLALLRIANGISNAVFIVSSSTLIAGVVADERLEDGIGFYRVTSSLSVAISPAISTEILARWGFTGLFSVMSVLSLAGLLLLFGISRRDCPVPQPLSLGKERPPLALSSFFEFAALAPSFVAMFSYVANSSTNNYLVAFGESRQLPSVSYFFLINCLFMLVARGLFARLRSRFTPRLLIPLGMCLGAAAYFLIATATAPAAILLAGVCSGIAEGTVTPTLNAMVFRLCRPDRRGVATATFGVFNDLGTSLGAILWGSVSAQAGYPPIFFLAAACCAAGAGLCLLILPRSPRSEKCSV